MNESDLSKLIQTISLSHHCKLFRNNAGCMTDKTGRSVRYGLGNISNILWRGWKTSDLIGYTKIKITPEMIGQTLAVFTAIEVKLPTSKKDARYSAQELFINQVKNDGGCAAIIKSVDELENLFKSFHTQD